MDDIQDYWLKQGQLVPMSLFLSKNQSLSLGLIMNSIGNDSKIINKIREGFGKGIFELAIHGWNHVDFDKLSQTEQTKSMTDANKKLFSIFKNKSTIFIPPNNVYNNDTIKSMERNNLKIISAADYSENSFDDGKSIFNASSTAEIQGNEKLGYQKAYHLPETSSFKNYYQGKWIKNPLNNIIGNVSDKINKYGYAVIVLHPQDFVKLENNTFTNLIDDKEIKDLSYLIDYFKLKNIPIESFSKVANSQIDPCTTGFTVTGYYTPIESDYSGHKKTKISIIGLGKREFNADFLNDVKIEGWGKTNQGWYIGYDNGIWSNSTSALNSNGQPLSKGSAAVDHNVIPNEKQFTISTILSPYNSEIFFANDIGNAITGKHVDVYTGEGRTAGIETLKITGKNNTVCYC
ncbi:MAG: polysaccharide deacetylase family protein [Candidatus Nitrosocosmicus sp.]